MLLYAYTATKNNNMFFVIAIVTSEFTLLILQKYSFRVCVILFGCYSTHFKVYIHLSCINTQQWTTSPLNNTPLLPFSNRWTKRLYQGSPDLFEGDHNSNIICLLQPSQEIQYCNQLVLTIVPGLNIFDFSILVFDLISRKPLVRLCILHASYLYTWTGLRFYIFFSYPALHLCDRCCHGWVYYMDTTKIRV